MSCTCVLWWKCSHTQYMFIWYICTIKLFYDWPSPCIIYDHTKYIISHIILHTYIHTYIHTVISETTEALGHQYQFFMINTSPILPMHMWSMMKNLLTTGQLQLISEALQQHQCALSKCKSHINRCNDRDKNRHCALWCICVLHQGDCVTMVHPINATKYSIKTYKYCLILCTWLTT